MRSSALGKGVYAFSEAARLIEVRPTRVSAWFRGRPTGRGPVLTSDYGKPRVSPSAISFLDLIEALVASKLHIPGMPRL